MDLLPPFRPTRKAKIKAVKIFGVRPKKVRVQMHGDQVPICARYHSYHCRSLHICPSTTAEAAHSAHSHNVNC